MNAADALARYLELVQSYDGCGAQLERERFGAAVAPNGPDGARAWFCTPNVPADANSSCEVAAAGLLAVLLAELELPLLQEPLDNAAGSWARLRALAAQHGALRTAADFGAIAPGWIVHLESATGRHWRTVVKDLAGGWYESIDGGAKDAKGYQLIHRARWMLRAAFDVTSGKPIADLVDVPCLLASLLNSPST